MKILKLKKHWDQDDLELVDDTGCITNKGIWKYWMSIDEALEFWEHGKYNKEAIWLHAELVFFVAE